MPYIVEHNKVAVTVDELVPKFWSSQNVLSKDISRNREKNYGIKALQRGCRGRKLLIDFDTLPENIQEYLGDPRRVEHNLLHFYKTERIAVDFYTDYRRPDGAYLTASEQQRYITNASVLMAILQLRERHIAECIKVGKNLKGINTFLCNESNSFNELLENREKPTHNLPTNPIRFKQTLEKFEIEFKYNDISWPYNFESIIKDVEGKRKTNALVVDDRVEMILNGLFANISHKPNVTEIHRAYDAFLNGYAEVYNETTGEIFNPKEFKAISESTVRNWLMKYENKVATYKERSGNRQVYIGQFIPHHQMERPKFSGSLISIDDRQPPFKDLSGNRVWFYNGLDVASGCITVFVYGKTKEGIITEFYRQMVRNYTEWGFNLPAELEAELSLNSSFTETFLQEGYMFEYVRIEANNARGKIIERDNGILRYNIEKKRPGWLARPSAKSEANQQGSEKVPQLPYDEIVQNAIEDIFTLNNSPHMEAEGKTRWEYFVENQNPDLQPTNWRAILPYLGYKTVSSCNAGYINLQGKKRAIAQNGKIALGEDLISVLKSIEGKEFDIYWLDSNNGSVLKALVYYDNRFVCEVQEMPIYNRSRKERDDAGDEARKIQSAYVATVEAFIRHQQRELQKINIIEQPKPQPENGFYIPGMNIKRFTPDAGPAQIIDVPDDEDYSKIPLAPEIDFRNSFFK